MSSGPSLCVDYPSRNSLFSEMTPDMYQMACVCAVADWGETVLCGSSLCIASPSHNM